MGLFPNPSASAEGFNEGDVVKWMISDNHVSPYNGVVTRVEPAIQKVWVEFTVGGHQQRSPEELILVTKFTDAPVVDRDSGYSSIARNKTKDVFKDEASFDDPKVKKMARQMVLKKATEQSNQEKVAAMATKVAQRFAADVVDKISSDVLTCHAKGFSDVATYQAIFSKYEKICSDSFMRKAIANLYKRLDSPKDAFLGIKAFGKGPQQDQKSQPKPEISIEEQFKILSRKLDNLKKNYDAVTLMTLAKRQVSDLLGDALGMAKLTHLSPGNVQRIAEALIQGKVGDALQLEAAIGRGI